MGARLWQPDPAHAATSRMAGLVAQAKAASGQPIQDVDGLWQWSVTDRGAFWSLVWADLPILAVHPPSDLSAPNTVGPPDQTGERWFGGSTLNFSDNLLRKVGSDASPALIARDEAGRRVVLSRASLRRKVAALARCFLDRGVQVGDRVAGFLPNREEAVIAMLAATRIGAVWSSCSPDFGFEGVLDRFGQIGPKVLVACDGYRYGGKTFSTSDRIARIRAAIPEVETLLWVDVIGEDTPAGAVSFEAACADDAAVVPAEALPFDHPVYIMYSSGTTGKPKCIVHGAGGTLLQHGKELVYHSDVREGDALFWYTTTGWMMWNWLVSGLMTGATVVLYDGSPVASASPEAFSPFGGLWRMAQEEGLTHFGTSPKFLASCQKAGFVPREAADLSRLRVVMSTGSPLAEEQFSWVAEHVGNVQLASICGGTDILGCFMLGSPLDPVYAGEIQKRGLGMAVEAWDEHGAARVGHKGELVCTKPFPSMPVRFWNDPEGKKYASAYFESYPGVWRHGDWVEITEHGGVVVYGRSDATLNPGGVRIGTAEIYAVVERLDEVADSLVVSQRWEDDTRVVLFVVPAPGVILDGALVDRIKRTIRTQCTPRHVPAKIIAVADLPRTISGKKVEIAVQRVIHGEAVENRDALANPAALDAFVDLPALKG